MELQFRKDTVSCLKPVLHQLQNLEQTQEVRIPEGMPEVAQVLGCWGQVVLRSKEWGRDSLGITGGVMVWVLYMPEDGGQPQKLENWVPFQTRWDFPPDTPEGNARVLCLLRFADARSVTPGKLMLRIGIGVLAEGWVNSSFPVYLPGERPEGVELLQNSYPLRLIREVGEKQFRIEEELTVPASAPHPEKLLYYRMEPEVGDRKVLGGRLVFRGNGNLHMLYSSEEGQLHSWDFELPFSQFADLTEGLSGDAQADIRLSPTNVELELDEEGKLHLKAAVTAQYLVDDRHMIQIVEDAYCPDRELKTNQTSIQLPVLLDSRREMIQTEASLPEEAGTVADISFLPDFPRQRPQGDALGLELPGSWQILYYTNEGVLQSVQQRWEGKHTLKADGSDTINALPLFGGRTQTGHTNTIQGELPLQIDTSAQQELEMISALTLGEEKQRSPGRPSLILCRAQGNSLWELAKNNGSAMEAIRNANGLEADPVPGQMLLIPIL